jgi:hypothetical protein
MSDAIPELERLSGVARSLHFKGYIKNDELLKLFYFMQDRFENSGFLKFERMEKKRKNGGKLWIIAKILKMDPWCRYANKFNRPTKSGKSCKLPEWDRVRKVLMYEPFVEWFSINKKDIVRRIGSDEENRNLRAIEDADDDLLRRQKEIKKEFFMKDRWLKAEMISSVVLKSNIMSLLETVENSFPRSRRLALMTPFVVDELTDIRIAEAAFMLIKIELFRSGIRTRAV